MHSRFKIAIETTPKALWAVLTDPKHTRHWMPEVESIAPRTPDSEGVGTISDMTIREGNKLVEYIEESSAWSPGSHLGIVLSGGSLGASPMHLDYRIHPHGDRVELEYTGRWQPTEWTMRLLSPLSAGAVTRTPADRPNNATGAQQSRRL